MDPDLLLKNVKGITKETGIKDLRVVVNPLIFHPARTSYKITDEKGEGVKVLFKKTQRLSVFQAELLYDLVHLQKRPRDYAKYHKCPAGIRFFENIEGMNHLKIKPQIIEEDIIITKSKGGDKGTQ